MELTSGKFIQYKTRLIVFVDTSTVTGMSTAFALAFGLFYLITNAKTFLLFDVF